MMSDEKASRRSARELAWIVKPHMCLPKKKILFMSFLRLERSLRLADFIVSQKELILQEWENFARTLEPAASGMDDAALRDHAALMLEFIAVDLSSTQSANQQIQKSQGLSNSSAQDWAKEHGLDRLDSDFTMEQVFSEYRALRASVLRLWRESKPSADPSDIDDMIRFGEAIDQLIAGSVFSFAKAQRESEASERERRNQFLAMLGHELRNPLSPIRTASVLLKKVKNNQTVIDQACDVIERQVSHMASLVDDILDVSRVTRGLVEVRLEKIDLREVISDSLEQVMPNFNERNIRVTSSEHAEAIYVVADKKRLIQVVTNLLTNSAKYTLVGGNVALALQLQHPHVALTVDDDGVGMTPQFMLHAFDLFSQVEPSSARSDGGLGLGLALVKSLVELHGGSVSCTSDGIGKGSQFTVRLPIEQCEHDGNAKVGKL